MTLAQIRLRSARSKVGDGGVFVSTLAIALGENGELPTDFRIFEPGWNDTTKGRFLFDATAAKSVMDSYAEWGVDLMIDLEHQSLEEKPSPDPTSRDARGWCRLELRDDGSLWAVDVTWTPDGAARLREKRQRYVSPAFWAADDGRVASMINIAICGMPATYGAPALVAASRRRVRGKARTADRRVRSLTTGPSFEDVRTALQDAVAELFPRAEGDDCAPCPWVVDVFDASVVFQLAGALYEAPYTYVDKKTSVGTPVEVQRSYTPVAQTPTAASSRPSNTEAARAALSAIAGDKMDPKTAKEALDALASGDDAKCAEILKRILAESASGEPADPGDDGASPDEAPPAELDAGAADGDEDEDEATAVAASARLLRLSGKSTISAAVADVEEWRRKALAHDDAVTRLAKERATLELGKRKENAIALTKLGAETPHTTGLANGKLCARLLDEPLEEQSARVAALLAARGGKMPAGARPPANPNGEADGGKTIKTRFGEVTLSAREIQGCKEVGATVEDYAENKAIRASARARTHG